MAKVTEITRGVHLSISSFAEEFGITRETAAKRIAAAKLKPSAKRSGHPVYRLRDIIELTRVDESGQIDPEKLTPFERHAHYRAEHEMLVVGTMRGELVPRIEVEQEQARLMKVVSQTFDTLPDRLERDCALTPQMVATVEHSLDQARSEMHKIAAEAEPEDDAASAVL